LLDPLNYYHEHPIDLNHASQKELKELSLLNDIQISALLGHISRNGKLIALEELQTIDGFDAETIKRILPFVTLNNSREQQKITPNKILTEGNHRLLLRYQQVLEKQKGYERDNVPYTDSKWYVGTPAKYYLRYRYRLSERLTAGLTAEKDAGEPFLDSDTMKKGFDFYSAHLFYYGKNLVRTLALGDYHIQYGQGLVLWSGLAFGKSADVLNVKKNARGIIPYLSVEENVFMRGGAVSVGSNNFQTDIFYSDKKIDGTINTEQYFVSLLETGKHRTYTERLRQKTIGQKIFGGHMQYSDSRLNIGATAIRTEFSEPMQKEIRPFNQYTFTGAAVTTYGIDYSYLWKNISFFGETGRSDNGSMATVNGALMALDRNVSVAVVNRHYERDYVALQGNAFGENTVNANENGTYLAIAIKPIDKITINTYFDRFNFPWLRYLVNAPSNGYGILSQLTYLPSKTFEAYFRYRERSKPENELGDDNPLDVLRKVVQRNYRLNFRYKASLSASFISRIEWVTYAKEGSNTEHGFMILQEAEVKIGRKISAGATYVLFDTDSYNSRIYAYEADVPYSYYIPFYYYRGNRYVLNLHYSVTYSIDFWLRYSQTRYSNLSVIGSGLDEIDGDTKSEIKLQLRFSF
jgi:hypothetical protein